MKKQEEEKQTVANSGDRQKQEWVKPDIHLYPIEDTLSGSDSNPDGGGLS